MSNGNGTLWKSHGMGYESSALLVGFAAQVGKGPAKAQEFVGSPRGTQTSVCLYRRAEMPPLVQRPWMYQVCEDTVFSTIPSFGWVFLPGSNWYRLHTGDLLVSVDAHWARVKPGSCLAGHPAAFQPVERAFKTRTLLCSQDCG